LLKATELQRVLTLYPILHELPAHLQQSFYGCASGVQLRSGEILFDSARPIPFFLFLTSGSIRVVRVGKERQLLLYRVQPGEVCGLSVCHILAGTPYQAVAFTEQAVDGVAIPLALFTRLVESFPPFFLHLFRSFSERVVELLALLEAVSFNQLDNRLAQLLLSRGATVEATHSQLADDLGTVREVISRLLREFERQGLVQLERTKIQIVDRPALAKVAQYLDDVACRSGA
jgi:CRP/FNR family transcriptional regulator